MLKKIIVFNTVIILMLLSLSTNIWAAYTKITMEDLKLYFESISEEEGIKTINIVENALEINGGENQTAKLYYDSENNIFYSEETFENTMNIDIVKTKIGQIATLPFYGFCAVAEKNEIDKKIYETYVTENGLLKSSLLKITIDDEIASDIVKGLDSLLDNEFETTMNLNCDYYSTKWEKVKEDSKITIKQSLIIKTDEDFSKMEEKVQDKSALINKENADIKISLKVGETYNIKIDEKPTGYSLKGGSCVEFSEDRTKVTGIKEGICYGILYFGDSDYTYTDSEGKTETIKGNQTQKTIYIEVVEDINESNEETKNKDDKIEEGKETIKKDDDTTVINTKLPQTGKTAIYVFGMIFILITNITYIIIKLRKNRI